MQVDDSSLFREYHSIRLKDHIPIQKFIAVHHLRITERRFYHRYRDWLLANNLEYPFWNAKEYIDWYGRYYKSDAEIMERCHTLLDRINQTEPSFNALTIATTIFFIVSGKPKQELCNLAGISTNPMNQCVVWMRENGIVERPARVKYTGTKIGELE